MQGDIIHKAIAIESGAHFEGTVQRSDNPFENLPDKRNNYLEEFKDKTEDIKLSKSPSKIF